MVVRVLLALLCILPIMAAARAQPPDARLSVSFDSPPARPLERELLLLTIRGEYPVPVALEKLLLPDLDGFAWMELGRDTWRDEDIGGLKLRVFERRMALFPQRPGRIEIGRFVHRLTILGNDGKRLPLDVPSQPLAIDIAAKPMSGVRWFPARTLALRDAWDVPPGALGFGQSARRTITLEADGADPLALPPQPAMGAEGLAVFPDPEERTAELTPNGPIARVTWRWTVRMVRPRAKPLTAPPIAWFDTQARMTRELPIPPAQVSLAGGTEATSAHRDTGMEWPVKGAASMLGLVLGLFIALRGLRLRPAYELDRLLPGPSFRGLRRAARGGDLSSLRREAQNYRRMRELRRLRPPGPGFGEAVGALDRHLFGEDGPAPSARQLFVNMKRARRG